MSWHCSLLARNSNLKETHRCNSSLHGFNPVDLILQEPQSEQLLSKSSDVAQTQGNEGSFDVHTFQQ